jgi:hypothetical protein
MYSLPSNFDVEIFSRCYLEMISFGPCITKLDFCRPQQGPGKPYRVTCVLEGPFQFMCNGVVGTRDLEHPESIAPLLGLMMRDVKSIKTIGNSSLTIAFEPEGHVILDGDNSSEFEAYTIYPATGKAIVV